MSPWKIPSREGAPSKMGKTAANSASTHRDCLPWKQRVSGGRKEIKLLILGLSSPAFLVLSEPTWLLLGQRTESKAGLDVETSQ